MDTKDTERFRDEVRPEQPGDGATPTEAPAEAGDGRKKLSLAEIKGMSAAELMPYFKDVRNKWLTIALFEETCEDPAKYPPLFTLKEDDTASCVSLRRLYMAMADVTEYKFAEYCLGGWDHWQEILKSRNLLLPTIEKWRRDLDLHLRATYLAKISEIAESDGPVALQATKYLLETTTGIKPSKRGRPSKMEKEAAIQEELRDSDEIRRDMERLGIKLVK